MNKNRLLVLCALLIFLMALFVIVVNSSVNYKLMSHTEMLKNQIMSELEIYDNAIFIAVDVSRSWYSISPSDWIFIVTLAPDAKTQHYKYQNGQFVLMEQ